MDDVTDSIDDSVQRNTPLKKKKSKLKAKAVRKPTTEKVKAKKPATKKKPVPARKAVKIAKRKPAKKTKLSALAKFHRTNPADRPGGWKKAAKPKTRPKTKTCRMDVRITAAERTKLVAAAKKQNRSITAVFSYLIGRL